MFEKLCFDNDLEKLDFEKYIEIRGKFVFKQIYDFLLNFNNEKVKYSNLSTCIKYDKSLRNTLYIYLAAFEEYLRAQILNRYEINKNFIHNKKNNIINMAENMYESTDKEHSVLYDMFSLDLGQTIRLVKALEMFNAEKVRELNDIRILRNIVMHHNLLILGKDKSLKKIRKNKAEMKNRIVALANNLPKDYGQNFIRDINALRCDFREYKITIEA